MLKSLMLIVNPVAGKGRVRYNLYGIVSEFAAAGYAVDIFMTKKGGDATAFAAEYGAKHDLVVCIGGDGTLSETMAGIMHVAPALRPAIGYIPMGTANDVSTTLKLSHNPREAAQAVINGTPAETDIGRLGDDYFSYIAAFGSFTEVSYSTPQERKRVLGHLAYVLQGMASLQKITSYKTTVVYDDGVIEGDFLFGAVTNSTSVAGLVRLDESTVNLSDGYFEILLIRSPQEAADLNNIITSILNKNYDPTHVIYLHSKKIAFTFDQPVAWTRDGEAGGEYTSVEAENISRAIRLIY